MKIDEVPQDKGFLIKGKISDLTYALDNNGNYISTQSEGWKPKNEAMTLAWSLIYEKAEIARKGVINGKLSPLAFYMELNIMDAKILSGYTGISRWRVKRHLKMKYFKKLKIEEINKYAVILNLSAEDLTDIDKIREFKYKNED